MAALYNSCERGEPGAEASSPPGDKKSSRENGTLRRCNRIQEGWSDSCYMQPLGYQFAYHEW